jgi:hypothetical protein
MDEFKDQIYSKVSEDTDIFKRIASRVPGCGYIERTKRRFGRNGSGGDIRALPGSGRPGLEIADFISQGEITYVDSLESTAIKLRTFADG